MDLHNKLRTCLDVDILPRELLADWSKMVIAMSAVEVYPLLAARRSVEPSYEVSATGEEETCSAV